MAGTLENESSFILTAYLYSDAPEDFLRSVKTLEDHADSWLSSLNLSKRPWNLASWLSLTTSIEIIEGVIGDRGFASPDHKAAMMNLGLDMAILLDQLRHNGSAADRVNFRISKSLHEESAVALDAAHRYTAFAYLFPLWYRAQYYAELTGISRIRFTAMGGAPARRVSAFHKGFRCPGYPHAPEESPQPMLASPEEMREMASTLDSCRPIGDTGFFYPKPMALFQMLFDSYRGRLLTTFRRNLTVSVGRYNLDDFSRFYSALLAICGTHEHLCHLWSQNHLYPLDSAILVKERRFWIQLCSRLSSLSEDTVDAIIADLSFGATRPLDLHVHPFVPLSQDSSLLAVAPHFPLFSKSEENILRVCSYVRNDIFSLTSLTKEQEMRQNLLASAHGGLKVTGSIKLPSPVPDIDLIFVDEKEDTVVICELKWIRKPSAALERLRADEEFLKGLKQLKTIQTFLDHNPDYLRGRGVIRRDLSSFKHIHFFLVARDHFLWAEPTNDIAVVDFQPFKEMLQSAKGICVGAKQLLEYEWLPQEGRDFVVRYDSATINGTTIEGETFYSPESMSIPVRKKAPHFLR